MPTLLGKVPEVKSLRGELCWVDTEPGLRPFSRQDSPVGRSEVRGREQTETLWRLSLDSKTHSTRSTAMTSLMLRITEHEREDSKK